MSRCITGCTDIVTPSNKPDIVLVSDIFNNSKPRFPKRKKHTKSSAGIACCRFNKNKYEVLMVRKRYTYEYSAFVLGQYNSKDSNAMIELFNHMTMQEKIDIASLNFNIMWWRIWLNFPSTSINVESDWLDIYKNTSVIDFIRSSSPTITQRSKYIAMRDIFERSFLQDNGKRLMSLLYQSNKCGSLIWEIPKGRKNKDENDLECANREFQEEVNLKNDDYFIVNDINPFIDTFSHMGVTYSNTYYVAIANTCKEPCIRFDNLSQVVEIDAIKWMGIDEFRNLGQREQTRLLVTKIFKTIKNRCNLLKG